MANSSEFGPLTPAIEVAAAFPNNIHGKTVIITGVSPKSLGLATAAAFASQSPANLILTGRSPDKVEAAINELKSIYPNVKYHALILDLASQSSVRAAAAQLNKDASIPSVDILINNAGVMAIPTLTTPDFATNHIGHFLFTNLILPKLIKAASTSSTPTRIINVTSFGHQFSPVRFSDVNFTKAGAELPESERPEYQKTEFFTGKSHADDVYYGFFSYAQSKTANILHSVALNQKLWEKHGIASFAVHPGAVDTNINRHATPSDIELALKRVKELGFDSAQKTPGQGANTTVFAAVGSDLRPVGFEGDHARGAYLADCKVDDENVAAFATNKVFAERLWALSEELVGEKFDF
ncbi:uncharacterized protein DSM5745_09773 [Aspergillus mulundensis]|uniref:Short-chain dehydrogenase n=1 Tax=Aspergillus mulundensis TaxID=1810919 RepID=A0A3D8QRE1_9EURO|nr:Uncharacterized protein DSM5745_09773 [Aspergillus mulundensis]RDW64362.1 Uncharacterized protein DSM5745_09773 [Aspergillus mulundensis]